MAEDSNISPCRPDPDFKGSVTQMSQWTDLKLLVLLLGEADGPVGERATEKPVGPPPRHEDVQGVGNRLAEHGPEHLRHLRQGLVVGLLLHSPGVVIRDQDHEDVGTGVLLLWSLQARRRQDTSSAS